MSENTPLTDDVYRIYVDVPASLPTELINELFEAVAKAVHAWEPADRGDWDAQVDAITVRSDGEAGDVP